MALILAGCGRAPLVNQDPVTAADAFFATLEKGDARGAYESAAFGFQAAQTVEGFLSNARDLGLVGGQPPEWTDQAIQGTEAHLNGTVINKTGNPVKVTVTMTADGKEWKLFALQTGAQEDPFTLVGKGSGFNDVYHQPMPTPGRLDELVRETMMRFNNAIKSGDFHDFYTSAVSQQWKNGERLTGAQAAGVTENMLRSHFQPFIDKKIDLSAVGGLAPVYDEPPQINADGLLETKGHFDAPTYRTNFEFEYVYELPFWKLFGINLNITK